MVGLAEDQGTKRKRVFRACDSCRAMKSKCDGARPACGRCTGYGYKCLYGFAGKRNHSHRIGVAPSTSHDGEICRGTIAALQLTARDYSNLVRAVLPKLPEEERADAEAALQKLDGRVREVQVAATTGPSPPGRASKSPGSTSLARRNTASGTAPARPVERYLGEVSDVRFFNLVDRALAETGSLSSSGSPGQNTEGTHHHDAATVVEGDALESYEQDDPSPEAADAHDEAAVQFPGAEAAGRYLDIYFSTIHVAYPYIPQALFMQTYQRYLTSLSSPPSATLETSDTWQATMYTLFAIGAYYDKAASGSEDNRHEQYYRHALALSNTNSTDTLERSLHQVTFLLAECFYLLAVCRTDKCWTTLGLAVRIAQSIGLHVDSDPVRTPAQTETHSQTQAQTLTSTLAFRNAELRRRVWYSVYVLDRLLALQLGRPPAIHDEDCHLLLPSRLGDGDIDWLGSSPEQSMPDPDVPTVGDYFVRMIALSKIIGYVLRDLYSPRGRGGLKGDTGITVTNTDETLTNWLIPSTKKLDRQLLEWRRTLPRKLRFDFGHAFDAANASPTTLAIYKRQRNMLAIKFHHLRAVIHRPYLCLPLLHKDPSTTSSTTTPAIARRHETVCILEARATAHLLHNVVDKQNLVHDYPWWQMISCLVYASSILVVASAFARRRNAVGEGASNDNEGSDIDGGDMDTPTPDVDADATDAAALEDDAETCLTVFEALSPSSESARLARDMMRRLKARGAAWRDVHGKDMAQTAATHQKGAETMPLLAATASSDPLGPLVQGPLPPTYAQPPPMADVAGLQPPQPQVQATDFVPLPTPGAMQTDALTSWPMLQEWPLEILDSMEWSTQFFNTVEGQQQQ
ncbi:hypothetical protein Sste5346_004699 [Sporothrix stenoceras]|uniref:Zn(2)-C6 fungal-type domain-containing protein n=1 Tax=Sporothrix stenoceras TaxID=5173 RepID=A0ABR3Z7J1_9PEZI